jgi:hypothetical protein
MSLTRGDEVPHVLTRKSRLQPAEFLITSAKRLLQHNRPKAAEALEFTSGFEVKRKSKDMPAGRNTPLLTDAVEKVTAEKL